jgi:hypothetical protein
VTDEVYLLAALRIGAGVDPAPLSVSAAARAAYALRLPGALTAELVPLPQPTGARDGAEPRLHRFAAPGLTIDVELTHTDARVDVAGQVTLSPVPVQGARTLPLDRPVPGEHTDALSDGRVPAAERAPAPGHAAVNEHAPWSHRTGSPAGGRVVIRTPHDRWVRLPTETGYFAATGLPVGWLSIACHLPGHPTVATRWLHTGG